VSPIVEATGVAKRWDESARLAPVSLAIDPGDLVVVQGRSGTGKSTLVGILAGWCDPDEGTVTWSPAVGRAPDGSPSWHDVAIVPQLLAVDDDLLVEENVAVPLRAGGAPPAEAQRAATEALGWVDVAALAGRWPRELSTGERQRLAVARAVAGGPRLVLADEPTSHQDAGHAWTVVDVLRRLVDGGAAALVTSHDPAVARHATSIVTLT
jgi:ABC-type lipoprotein export system ATPase subunit